MKVPTFTFTFTLHLSVRFETLSFNIEPTTHTSPDWCPAQPAGSSSSVPCQGSESQSRVPSDKPYLCKHSSVPAADKHINDKLWCCNQRGTPQLFCQMHMLSGPKPFISASTATTSRATESPLCTSHRSTDLEKATRDRRISENATLVPDVTLR